jgi:hypothetical protein
MLSEPVSTWIRCGRTVARRDEAESPRLDGILLAAPFVAVALWAAAIGGAVLLWAVTGQREVFDWCRSEMGLAAGGALVALAALVASLVKGVEAPEAV